MSQNSGNASRVSAGFNNVDDVVAIIDPARAGGFRDAAPSNLSATISYGELLEYVGARARPMFSRVVGASGGGLVDSAPSTTSRSQLVVEYQQIAVAPEQRLALIEQARRLPEVLAIYAKPAAEPASINDMLPAIETAPDQSPSFVEMQDYLSDPPHGLGVSAARAHGNVYGAGVGVCDVEGGWNLAHEDLRQNVGGLCCGLNQYDRAWRNHGTAVIGILHGDVNDFGVTGICPHARLGVASIFHSAGYSSTASAIQEAAGQLVPGDILVVEIHRPGPRYGFESRGSGGQDGYIPIEWWEDDFVAIRAAVDSGIIVVEAAGNGGEDLDDDLYESFPSGNPYASFTSAWRNPFRRGLGDSGAILVGAGAAPRITDEGNWSDGRWRLPFSNYGQAVDAQGWGERVVTTGYGDLQGGDNQDRWYTAEFSGTSSATPMVAGALACVQGVLDQAGRPRLNPGDARNLLQMTGSPQCEAEGAPMTQRIGALPNLEQMIDHALSW